MNGNKTDETHELACATCRTPFTKAAYAYGHGRVFCSGVCRNAYPGHAEAVLRNLPEPLQGEVRSCKDGPFASPLLNWAWRKGQGVGGA